MEFIPGFFQGASRVLVSYPFDYVKTHMQKNKFDTYKQFFKSGEIKNVYRGVSMSLCTIPFDRAVQFYIFENVNKHGYNPLVSGLVSGGIGSVYNLPLTYFTNNYVLLKNKPPLGLFIKETLNRDQHKLFNGFKPEIARLSLATTIYLGIYGNMRKKYGNSQVQCIINSATAGIILWTFTYPFETVKLEQQTTNMGTIEALKTRVRLYGIMNLWKGILPVYIRTIPSSIVGMFVYENCKKIIGL